MICYRKTIKGGFGIISAVTHTFSYLPLAEIFSQLPLAEIFSSLSCTDIPSSLRYSQLSFVQIFSALSCTDILSSLLHRYSQLSLAHIQYSQLLHRYSHLSLAQIFIALSCTEIPGPPAQIFTSRRHRYLTSPTLFFAAVEIFIDVNGNCRQSWLTFFICTFKK